MKVRVRHVGPQYWAIEVKHWYWPFWTRKDVHAVYDKALAIADIIKNPTIIEVQKS